MCDFPPYTTYIARFFKSKAHMYAFILIHTDGHIREYALGITERLYENKELANKWYETISADLLHGKISKKLKTESMKCLDALYQRMVISENECDYGGEY